MDAYKRLKLEMDGLKQHDDELDFFVLEQKSRRSLYGKWYANWAPVTKLELFGCAFSKPSLKIPAKTISLRFPNLCGRVLTLPPFSIRSRIVELRLPTSRVAFALALGLYGLLCDYARSYVRPLLGLLIVIVLGVVPFWAYFGPTHFGRAFGLSNANTFAVFGFRKELIEPALFEGLPGVLKFFAALQTGAGIVLIFLFGLAIRNLFRMK